MSITIKERDMNALANYQTYLYTHPKLTFLFFELTDCCNLKCIHCGSKCDSHNSTFLKYESISKVLTNVSSALNPEEIMICLTGGEPLLHKDVFKIIQRSKALGFKVGMTSNGTLISKVVANQLKESGLDTISISIDGLKNTHDAFRQLEGSYNLAMKGIQNLKECDIEPEVTTVVHKDNLNELERLYNLFSDMNIYSWRIINVEPIGRAKENTVLLNKEELEYIYKFIKEKRFDPNNLININYGCSHFITYDYEKMIRDFYFQCIAGLKVASVMCNGDIGACLDIEKRDDLIQGNIYTDDFMDIWNKKFKIFRRDKSKDSDICKNCKHSNICRGDSTHTWDFDNKRPLYCINNLLLGEYYEKER